ncbi:MAG: hypothetical protein AB1428_03205 [Bacteroidota bacterium]
MTVHARMALSASLLLALGIAGCGGEKQIEPVKVGEMESYRDPAYGYSIQYPKGWVVNARVGRASFYNAHDVDKKFLDPTGPFPDGTMVMVDLIRTTTPDQERKRIMDDMTKTGFVLTPEQPATVGGKAGTKFTYTGQYTTSIKEAGEHYYIPVDTLLYDIRFAGFGGLFEAHRAVFNAVLATIQFPKPAVPGRDPTLPSENLAEYSGRLFSFQYPDNFNFTNAPRGSNEEVVELRGVRQDCSIRFDVFAAKGLTVEKVFDQNKGKYRATGTGKVTVGGLPGLTLTYQPTSNVERRFIFVVKNDKVYRVTLDWYRPQRLEYLAAYDNVVASVRIK